MRDRKAGEEELARKGSGRREDAGAERDHATGTSGSFFISKNACVCRNVMVAAKTARGINAQTF
jgi:hypothetical protein